jgi:anti-sigma regulatory factor (Ser/Thr protein kinase)
MVDTVLELAVPARFPQVSALRRAADAFLRETVSDDNRYQVLLVISELCTNAVEALHNPRAELTLRVRDLEECTIIEVEDLGPGFASAIGRPGANDDDERGRGLQVVQSLTDEMTVDRAYGRTTVRCMIRKT